MHDANAEHWLPVVGYEGVYEVSDLGRVRSINRIVMRGTTECLQHGLILKPKEHPLGYLRCTLSVENRPRDYYIHRLVATAFLGRPADPSLEVCHFDGDGLNNRLENLRWDTRKNNHADKRRHGTSLTGVPKRTTHCKHGHEFTPENTRIVHDRRGGDYRECRQCSIEAKRRFRRRRKCVKEAS